MDIKFHSDSKKLFRDNKEKVRAFLYSDYQIESHNHDFYEINIVLGGEGIHQIEDTRIFVKMGDVFVIPPKIIHSYYNTKNLDVYHILLHKDFIGGNKSEAVQIPGFVELTEIEPFLRKHFSTKMFLHLSALRLEQLKSELSFIQDDGEFDTEMLIPLKIHTTWKIIYWLSDLLFKQINSDKKKKLSKYEFAIIRALEYMHKNYGEKITIELLCHQVFLSRSTFLKNFREVCDCTPMQYLNSYRCKKALEIMENTNLSKTKIAHDCGFYDLSHMERMMKK